MILVNTFSQKHVDALQTPTPTPLPIAANGLGPSPSNPKRMQKLLQAVLGQVIIG